MKCLHQLLDMFQQDTTRFPPGISSEHLELRVANALLSLGMRELTKPRGTYADDWLKKNKPLLQHRIFSGWVGAPASLGSSFVHQPFGSQQYPDFVVIEGGVAQAVEVKSSKESAKDPMWNNGLPCQNGLYLYLTKQWATYFVGSSLVTKDEAVCFTEFFEDMSRRAKWLNQEKMKSQAFGFFAYPREMYMNSKVYNPQRDALDVPLTRARVEAEARAFLDRRKEDGADG